jgi:hypothetical protein
VARDIKVRVDRSLPVGHVDVTATEGLVEIHDWAYRLGINLTYGFCSPGRVQVNLGMGAAALRLHGTLILRYHPAEKPTT